MPRPREPRRPSFRAALAGSFAAGLLSTAIAFASFTSATSSSGAVATKQVFLGTRTTAAWDVWDNSGGGSGVDASDVLESADAHYDTTGRWSSSFSSTRYYDFDYFAAAPAGIAVSAATFDLRYASDTTAQACFYFEVRRLSDNTLLGAHGSPSSTLGCVSGTTMQSFSTSIAAEVTGTDVANDLRIRVYMSQAGYRAARIDAGTVLVTTAVGTQTLYEESSTDSSTGTAVTLPWALAAAGDSGYLTSASNWSSSFSSARWLRYTFPGDHVPAVATVTDATFVHSYRSDTTGTTSVYYEVYDGTTLLGSHGSSSSPYSSATTAFVTDTIPLPEVTTAAQVDGLIVRVYARNSSSRRSVHDLATVSVTYHVD